MIKKLSFINDLDSSEDLPKNPKKGETFRFPTKNKKIITMEATGKEGFGKWKITGNKQKK